jgi:hypothetical protein
MIKWVSGIIDGNIAEAKKYIHKAYELREEDKALADWCRDMAMSHMAFNAKGHEIVKRMIDDFAASGKHSDLAPGMIAVYKDKHNDIIAESAEVKAMIDAYK